MRFPPMIETDEALRHKSFDEAGKRAVCDAFNGAWLEMQLWGNSLADTGRFPEVRALLARQIINAARMGERDVTTLQMAGISYVRERLMPNWPKR